MPAQTIWMIRLSLVYLLIAVLLGGLIITHKSIELHPMIWSLLPVHFELAIWGWLVQFVMGTAYWMLPRKLVGKRRGPTTPAWAMVVLFNFGLILLVVGPFLSSLPLFSMIGRLCIGLSILLFALLIWSRVTTYRK